MAEKFFVDPGPFFRQNPISSQSLVRVEQIDFGMRGIATSPQIMRLRPAAFQHIHIIPEMRHKMRVYRRNRSLRDILPFGK
jgi:hypothetical protein